MRRLPPDQIGGGQGKASAVLNKIPKMKDKHQLNIEYGPIGYKDIDPTLSLGLIWLVAGIWLGAIALVYHYANAPAHLPSATKQELSEYRKEIGK